MLALASRSVRAIASPTSSGTCDPPGASRNAKSPCSDEKRSRTAATSMVVRSVSVIGSVLSRAGAPVSAQIAIESQFPLELQSASLAWHIRRNGLINAHSATPGGLRFPAVSRSARAPHHQRADQQERVPEAYAAGDSPYGITPETRVTLRQ